MGRLSLFILLYIAVGCTAYQYVSNPQPVPLFSEKHDLNINLVYNPFGNTNTYSNSCGFLGAGIEFAFSDHFGAFCNASFYDHSYGPSILFIGGTHHFYESKIKDINGAIGYFTYSNRLHYGIFTGIGYGTNYYKHIYYEYPDLINAGDNDTLCLSSIKYLLFLQPDVGFKIDKNLEIAFSTRLSLSDYILSNIHVFENIHNYKDEGDYFFYEKNTHTIVFIEPSLTFREGYEDFKFQQQIIFKSYVSDHTIFCKKFIIHLSIFISLSELLYKH